jgi:hypothetical protein
MQRARVMRARAVARKRRPLEPDAYLHAFQELCQLPILNGIIAYQWCVRRKQRKWPCQFALQVVVLLRGGFITADQLLDHLREFCEYEDVSVIVTRSSAAFGTICAVADDGDDEHAHCDEDDMHVDVRHDVDDDDDQDIAVDHDDNDDARSRCRTCGRVHYASNDYNTDPK